MFLNFNPICANYYEETVNYVSDLRKIFPKIEFIDGRRINANLKTVNIQNYLVKPSLYAFTENFISFFFDIYDSTNRKLLKNLYDTDSILTTSRELSLKSDESPKQSRSASQGKYIVQYFDSLPPSQHDLTTMSVDVPLMNDTYVLIHVNGYFKDIGRTLNKDDHLYGYSRTFLLKRNSKKHWNNVFTYFIANELFHIREIRADESNQAFKRMPVTEIEMRRICNDLLPTKIEEQHASQLIFETITNLKSIWCKRFV